MRLAPWAGRAARNLAFGALALVAFFAGAFAPLDRFLGDQRFSLALTTPARRLVAVEIDSASLSQIGVWPWPRALHAALVDRLVALGARRIVFDVDFSAASTPQNDRAFADALARASGKVWLAVFEQPGGVNGGLTIDAPLPELSAYSGAVAIDVPLDSDGAVRNYRSRIEVGGGSLPTAGALLADQPGAADFAIDYGLDLSALDRLSAADVLAGRTLRAQIEGRDVLIGASAEELRDLFLTPRYGMIPGLAVHALAAQSLLNGRALHRLPAPWIAALIVALAVGFGAFERRLGRWRGGAALAFAALGVEAGALALQKSAALLAPTAAVHAALAACGLAALLGALIRRRRLHADAARARDVTHALLQQVVADNFDGVAIFGRSGEALAASGPARAWAGETPRLDALPGPLAEAVAAALADAAPTRQGEARVAAPDGALRDLEFVVTASRLRDAPERRAVCLTFRDVTERRAHLARLDYLARHDETTGALTRAEFLARLSPGGDFALFCLGLRRFDLVTDVFGHAVGDCLLRAVAARLGELGFVDVARLDGARFAFAAPGTSALGSQGAALCEALARTYLIEGRPLAVGVALGAATTASGGDAATWLTRAGMAQTAAARRIGDVFVAFDPDMEGRRRAKQKLDADLRRAVAQDALVMHYQPKVRLSDSAIVGAEALMRWRTDDGFVSPTLFVPVAEETGLIVELGRFALRQACRDAAAWPQGAVAVNVSPVQFGLSDVAAEVEAALIGANLPASRLEIEITESAFVEADPAIAQSLERVRALGVRISLDDFGTGYSSLHYLGSLPIDCIKIDQSFVRAMPREPSAAATVQAVIALARAHGKLLVAEGIEGGGEAEALAAMGCDYGQGWLFGRPEPAAAFQARLLRRAAA